MRLYLIVAVLGCALISSAVCKVAETEHSLVKAKEVPQNVDQQAPIAAEPLSEATSPQLQKILSQIPEIIQEVTDEGQMRSKETIEIVNNNPDAVDALPQHVSPQSNREARQLIGFIPTYMLRQAMLLGQNDQDDEVYNASDEIEEERAIRRRKRFRRRNTRGNVKKTRRHKNINKRKHNNRRKVNTKRRSPNRYSSLRKRKVPRTKNRKTKNKNKSQTKPKRSY